MKKIIVLGMFFVSFSLQVVASDQGAWIDFLAVAALTSAAIGVKIYHQRKVIPMKPITAAPYSMRYAMQSILEEKSLQDFSSTSSDNTSLSDSQRSTPTNDKTTSLRGLPGAKFDKIYVADIASPHSVDVVDLCNLESIVGLVATQIPFGVAHCAHKKDNGLLPSMIRPVSPDDYYQVNALSQSPRKSPIASNSKKYDWQEDDYVVVDPENR